MAYVERYNLVDNSEAPNHPRHSVKLWARRLICVALVAYLLAFASWRLLVASPWFEQWWFLQLSEVFAVWAIVPLPFLMVGSVILRIRWLSVALLLPLLWFGRDYGTLFVPEMATRAKAGVEERSLRVMTFNTWRQGDSEGEFIATVEGLQPDLIALQEVDRSLVNDLSQLEETWPYQRLARIRVTSRVALLSKFPILNEESDNEWNGCHCAQFIIDWHGKAIRVIVVHIRSPGLGDGGLRRGNLWINDFDTTAQALSYAALIPQIRSSAEPVIVLGDFNTTERQAGYRALVAAGMRNAHAEAGWGLGLTFPAPWSRADWLPVSLIRIDHIFFGEAWDAIQSWTAPLIGSDHQALFADLRWVGDE